MKDFQLYIESFHLILKPPIKMAAVVFVSAVGWPVALLSHPNHQVTQPLHWPNYGRLRPVGVPETARAEARLSVTIWDAKTGEPTPARVRIADENGKPLGLTDSQLAVPGSVVGLPPEAIAVMYGTRDLAQGYAFQPDGAFYVAGSFDMPMPAGKFIITISKGYEFVQATDVLTLKPGDHLSRKYELRRWIDMPERGWYSADAHIHLRRSPRENPFILGWIAAEDVHVGNILQWGGSGVPYFAQYAWGEKGRYGVDHYILSSGQEDPCTDIGHTISLGAREYVGVQGDYYSYDRVFDRVHELGGVSGYAHQAISAGGHRGMTLDVLDNKIDFLEIMQFCVRQGPLALEHYYRFLDLGKKLTALAGSDFPWCGRSRQFGVEGCPQIGDARFYTYTGSPFSFAQWLDAVKAGHTFATTGPMLDFRVNDRLPGSWLDVKAGTKLRISAKAYGHQSQIPLRRLQIIGHGKILAEVSAGEPGQTPGQLSIDFELGLEHGIWLAVRADAALTQMAHTTPVYVTVDGDGFHNRSNLASQIELSKGYVQEIRELIKPPPDARARLERRIAEAERKLEELRSRR